MGSLGFPELLVILVIILVVFGAGKLPQIGDALGKSIRNFKRSASGTNEIEVNKKSEIEAGKTPAEEAEIVASKSAKK